MKKFNLQEIQSLLNKMELDAWLFYDFRKSNNIAHEILNIPVHNVLTRRFFYLIPCKGNPVKIVNAIEPEVLNNFRVKKFFTQHINR